MATSSITERRKKVMDRLTMVMNILDPTGQNSKTYEELLSPMSDAEFDKYIRDFFKNEKSNFYLEIVEYERDLTIENIERCAKYMNVPLLEKVAFPYLTNDEENVIVTPYPVPVGYIHEKRMPQTLMKKSAGSTKIQQRSPLTGQVTGEDKNARNSDLETYSLAAINATAALQEFMGPRADNRTAKSQMDNDIAKNGYVSLQDLNLDDPYNKVALNTFDTYYLMMGIKTNLVTNLDEIPGPRKTGK
jgi:hypothetical protein